MPDTKHKPVAKKATEQKKKRVFAILNEGGDPKGFKRINAILAKEGMSMSRKTFVAIRDEWNKTKDNNVAREHIPNNRPANSHKAAKVSVADVIIGKLTPVADTVRLVRQLLARVSKEDAKKLIDELS